MKVLFVHGGEKIKEDKEGNLYTGGSYNKEVWDRYISIFQNVSLIARKEPIIYEPTYAKQKFQPFDKNKISFIEIPNMTSSFSSFININNRTLANKVIKKAVLEHDCLIARLPSSAGYTAVRYAKKYHKSYLIEVVGCTWDALWNHSYKGKVLALPRYFDMKKSIKDAPYVIYVTNEFLQKRYPTKGKSIGCSDVVLPNISENVLDTRLEKIEQKRDDKPIILGTTAAIDVRYKGQEYVIKAISRLNKEGHNFEYYLAGGGDDSYLKNLAEKYDIINKVKFLGSLPHEMVFRYLDDIDIYIQPSKQEGLPRALIEAMSRGCPALGSTTGGIPELLNSDFIFHNGSVDEICKLLKMMNRNVMVKEAIRSFDKAKEYNKDLLNKKRNLFYLSFRESAVIHND